MSQLEVDKVIPQSGTTLTLGDSADTITIPSGATLDASNATLTLPDGTVTNAKVNASAAIAYSKLNLATSIVNADINTTAAIATTKLGAGAVLQVVTATDSTQRSTTSTSFVTASNTLSVTITPSSASNKVFVTAAFSFGTPSGTNNFNSTLFRGATNLGTVTKGFGTLFGGSSYIHAHATLQILDSPNTTSATTYQVYFSVGANTGLLNTDGGFSSITAFEIAG